jgi:tRNA (mo5U34)-methyltransferase
VTLTLSVDRVLAERIKRRRLYRRLSGLPFPDGKDTSLPIGDATSVDSIDWYQTIDLGDVVTPGFVDHRDQVPMYGIPDSLEGKRCLDVATNDGFWAFEMERRGAAEVIGIDLYSRMDSDFATNWSQEYAEAAPPVPKGAGFAYASRALGSRVTRRVLSVYELSPDVVGTFDFIFLSDLLIHLRDPLRALEAIWSVCRGGIVIAEAVDPDLEAHGHQRSMRFMLALDDFSGCLWWYPTASALVSLAQVARFQDVEEISRLELKTRTGLSLPKVVLRARGRVS